MFGHLKDEKMNYFEHFKIAITLSYYSFKASIVLLCHAVYPDIFQYTGSSIIKELNRKILKN